MKTHSSTKAVVAAMLLTTLTTAGAKAQGQADDLRRDTLTVPPKKKL